MYVGEQQIFLYIFSFSLFFLQWIVALHTYIISRWVRVVLRAFFSCGPQIGPKVPQMLNICFLQFKNKCNTLGASHEECRNSLKTINQEWSFSRLAKRSIELVTNMSLQALPIINIFKFRTGITHITVETKRQKLQMMLCYDAWSKTIYLIKIFFFLLFWWLYLSVSKRKSTFLNYICETYQHENSI